MDNLNQGKKAGLLSNVIYYLHKNEKACVSFTLGHKFATFDFLCQQHFNTTILCHIVLYQFQIPEEEDVSNLVFL